MYICGRTGKAHPRWSVPYITRPCRRTAPACGTLSGNQVAGATYDITDFDLINMQQIDPTTITVLDTSPYNSIEDLIKPFRKIRQNQSRADTEEHSMLLESDRHLIWIIRPSIMTAAMISTADGRPY
ncbi:MAG: hypothetical protein ACLUOI_40840 [Eisenbergiella sp.]